MFEYIVGKISYANNSYIVLENNFIGYKIFLNNIDLIDKNTFHRIYVYSKIFQNGKGNFGFEHYGFKTVAEKYFFDSLLTINGIGPKTAMNILKNDLFLVKKLIKNNDVNTLKSLNGFNERVAIAVVNSLSSSLKNDFKNNESDSFKEKNTEIIVSIIQSLKMLGYKKHEVEYALEIISSKINNITNNDTNEVNDLVSEAIKLIVNKNENSAIKTN